MYTYCSLKNDSIWNRVTEAVQLILPPETDFLRKKMYPCNGLNLVNMFILKI